MLPRETFAQVRGAWKKLRQTLIPDHVFTKVQNHRIQCYLGARADNSGRTPGTAWHPFGGIHDHQAGLQKTGGWVETQHTQARRQDLVDNSLPIAKARIRECPMGQGNAAEACGA